MADELPLIRVPVELPLITVIDDLPLITSNVDQPLIIGIVDLPLITVAVELPLITFRGMVKNLLLLRRAGNNGRPWVHAVMCDNIYSDICMIIHASTL